MHLDKWDTGRAKSCPDRNTKLCQLRSAELERQLAGETPYSASNSRELAGRRQFGSEKKFKLAQFSSKQKSLRTFCSQTQNKHFYQRDKKKGEFGTCCIVCHKLVVTRPAAP
ncbi:hypothetical protein BJ165DRAFT_1407739 [Panaeolus papilionaceus]|nr:hypothetical protein BJ165DRAFT_1407739 [Panaeolus papilionaceus]